jgi:predicted thioredoxin/glutaredoxin
MPCSDANMKVLLVTRKNCHLCDEALAALRAIGVEPELRDVDANDELFALYDWRVPVVTVDGRLVAEGRIDLDAVRRALPAV